jgi:putative phage-type endonuclease
LENVQRKQAVDAGQARDFRSRGGDIMTPNVLVNTLNLERDEWLEHRRCGIGGSDAAAIAGLNPWKSPFGVYMDKIDGSDADYDNERMRIGRDLEDYVAQRFSEATGLKVRRRNAMLQHPEHEFMTANIDRMIVGENAFLECKTTNSYAKKDWEDEIPIYYEIQCLHYMAVLGCTHCYIAVLIGNEKFLWSRIERDEETIQNLIKIEKRFWEDHILKQIPPEPDGSSEYSEILKEKYKSSIADAVMLPDSMEEYLNRYDELNDLSKQIKTEKEQIKQRFQVELGEHETGTIGERKISWKQITSNRFNSKKFRKDYPELYKKYQNESVYRRFEIR